MRTFPLCSALLWLLVAPSLSACGGPSEKEVVQWLEKASPEVQQRVFHAAAGQGGETTGVVKRGDVPLTLLGHPPEVGAAAPPFLLLGSDLMEIEPAGYAGMILLLSVVPSIDTSVCETQTHRMADEAPKLPGNVAVLTVSRDLPFAQSRFMQEARQQIGMGSDYRDRSFGRNWGLEVKETGLLARSVWLVQGGKIAYREIVADQGTQPDYDALFAKARELGDKK